MVLTTEERKYDSIINDADKLFADVIDALKHEDYISAITFLKQLILKDNKDLDAYVNIAYSYINIEEYQLAKIYLKKAFKIAKTEGKEIDSAAYLNYAYALAGIADENLQNDKRGIALIQYRKARNKLREYLKINKKSEEANSLLSSINGVIRNILAHE